MSELDRRHFFPEVLQAMPTDDYKVYTWFNDGSVRCVDVKPLIKPGTVFWEISDIGAFRSKLTVINDTVAWDIGGNRDESECIDLDPETIFDGEEVEDPLDNKS